jgi:hypothetical protein
MDSRSPDYRWKRHKFLRKKPGVKSCRANSDLASDTCCIAPGRKSDRKQLQSISPYQSYKYRNMIMHLAEPHVVLQVVKGKLKGARLRWRDLRDQPTAKIKLS